MAKRRSIVWKFFDLIEQEKDGIKVKNAACKICVDTILTYAGGTSNLMHHLEARHPNEYCKAKNEESGDESDKPMKQTSLPVRPSVKRCSLARSKEINTAIVDFVALDLRPIAVVDGCGFNKLLTCLEPGYTVPSRTFVMNSLKQQYSVMKQKLRESLSVRNLAITTDIWTSRATEAYMTITAHYISDEWKIESNVLCTCEMAERHTGANIALRIQEVLEVWNIQASHVSAVVTDNASNMTAALNSLECGHLPCFAHTLQLAVNKGLDANSLNQLSSLARKLVGHFKHSALATAALRQKQEQMNVPKHHLIQDVVTRWNSTFLMFQRLLEQRWVVYAVLLDERGSQSQYKYLHLKEEQWNLMEQMVTVLEPLQIATTALCETEIVSCSLIYPVINGLLKKHLVPGESDLPTVKRFKEVVAQDIERRFNVSVKEQNIAIFAAILDPRYHQLKFMDYSTRKTAYSMLKEKLALLSCEEECQVVQESASQSPKRKKKKTALAILLGEDEDDDSTVFTTSEEFEKYLKEFPLKSSENCLEWWAKNKHTYPNLAKLATQYLCVPATSVPAEQVFSVAGEIVNTKRASLKPENVDLLIFLNKNSKFLSNS